MSVCELMTLPLSLVLLGSFSQKQTFLDRLWVPVPVSVCETETKGMTRHLARGSKERKNAALIRTDRKSKRTWVSHWQPTMTWSSLSISTLEQLQKPPNVLLLHKTAKRPGQNRKSRCLYLEEQRPWKNPPVILLCLSWCFYPTSRTNMITHTHTHTHAPTHKTM